MQGGLGYGSVTFLRVMLGLGAIRSADNEIQLQLIKVKLSGRKFRELVTVGFPTALGQSSAALGFTLMNSIVVSYGQITLAAYAAVNRVSGLLLQPVQGLGSAMTPIVGQNLGAEQGERVKKFNKAAFKSVTIITVISGILLVLIRYPLLNLFIGEAGADAEQVWSLALEYVYYLTAMLPVMGYFHVFSGIFVGAGYHRYAAFLSIMRQGFDSLAYLPEFYSLGRRELDFAGLKCLIVPLDMVVLEDWFEIPR